MLTYEQLFYVLICVVFLLWYVYYLHCFTYWKKKGIPSHPPKFPAGNITLPVLGRLSLFTAIQNIYTEFKNKGHRHVGLYFFNGPVYVPIDPEIVKSILVTDFDYFVDRGTYVDEEKFCLTAHLFSLRGTEWKSLRKKLTPVFSTGRMKSFYEIFLKHSETLVELLAAEVKSEKEINVKTVAMNYTADIISSAAFGIDAHAQENPKNKLSENLEKIFSPSAWLYAKMVLVDGLHKPGNLLRVMHSDKSVEEFFRNFVKDAIKLRDSTKVSRKDLITLLLEIRDSCGLSFNRILAQCYLFYLAGFETASQTISYCIHELAHNQDIQDKLREEISENVGQDFSQCSYDCFMKMSYLDKVFKETLRLYPIMGTLSRICVKDYKIPGTDIVLEKGTPVLISTLGLHRDPEYYPEPLKFDPERFDDTKNLVPFTYLPFGEGPRFCIGMRFGTLQAKLGIAALVTKFRFHPSSKTPKVIEFDRLSKSPAMSLRDGITVKTVSASKMNTVLFLTTLLLLTARINSEQLDYYWRDYFGEIPDDALPGGSDQNEKPTYIGQIFIPNQGVLTTRIYEGQKFVTASKGGIHSSDAFIKVLCTDQPEKFSWIPTTAAKLQNDTAGKHLVLGGTEDGKVLNIGRVSYQGEVVVGKISSDSALYFPFKGVEIAVASYEVLVYVNAY